jgi:hypothetical protein
MLIRHAEKPPDSPPPYGVSDDGQPDAQSLTIRGWQRAGALAALFDPAFITSRKHRLLEPRYLYASNSHKHRSKRSRQTLMPLARKLGLEINADFSPGEEAELASHARSRGGVVLICWRHQLLPTLAHHLLGDGATAPQIWSDRRYDVVWVFDLEPSTQTYHFSQVAQNLLHGDSLVLTLEEGQLR